MSLWPPRMKRMEVIQHQNLSQAHICRTWRNGLWRCALDVYPGTRMWRFLLNSTWNSPVAAQHTTKADSNKGLQPKSWERRSVSVIRDMRVYSRFDVESIPSGYIHIFQKKLAKIYIYTWNYPTRLYAKWASSPQVMMKYFLCTSRFSSFSMNASEAYKHRRRLNRWRDQQLTNTDHPKARYLHASDEARPLKPAHDTHQ